MGLAEVNLSKICQIPDVIKCNLKQQKQKCGQTYTQIYTRSYFLQWICLTIRRLRFS